MPKLREASFRSVPTALWHFELAGAGVLVQVARREGKKRGVGSPKCNILVMQQSPLEIELLRI